MRLDDAITPFRHSVKQLVRTERFQWLSRPARLTWYFYRSVGELVKAPSVLLNSIGDIRSASIDRQVEFTFSNFGGMFRPFQNRVELARLLEHVVDLKPTNIVEIGTARGGTLFLLSCVANPAARIVSIDLPAGLYGGGYPTWKGYLYRKLMGKRQRLHLIRGNSHDDDIIRKAVDIFNGEPIDLLFIDGDHSYCGAKSDFLRYRTHVREGGWIVFHDILHNIHDKDITVAPLWREVVGKYQSTEIVESYDQGQFGLGVITSPAVW